MAQKRNNKFNKDPDSDLTLAELEIFKSQEMDTSEVVPGRRGKTYEETMAELHVDRGSIARTKKKADYNELARAALQQRGFDVGQYVENLIDLTKAEKKIISHEEGVLDVPDNSTRFNATSEIGDIFGAKAPKKLDLKHSMAAMSDEELAQSIDDTAAEIENNGHIRREIAGTQNAGIDIKNQRIEKEPDLVERGGE